MPTFSDIFIANSAKEAICYDITTPQYTHVSIPDLTEYELSILWACIANCAVQNKHGLEFIEIDSDAILYQLPQEFTESLASLNGDSTNAICSRWIEHDEILLKEKVAREKITALNSLAKQAIQESKILFLMLI